MSYEDSVRTLDEILAKLADENLKIEDGLKLYAEGVGAAQNALDALKEFRGKLDVLNASAGKLRSDISDRDSDDA